MPLCGKLRPTLFVLPVISRLFAAKTNLVKIALFMLAEALHFTCFLRNFATNSQTHIFLWKL